MPTVECRRIPGKQCGKIRGAGVTCLDCPDQKKFDDMLEDYAELPAHQDDSWLSRFELARLYEAALPNLTELERLTYRCILSGQAEIDLTDPLQQSLIEKLRTEDVKAATPSNVIDLARYREAKLRNAQIHQAGSRCGTRDGHERSRAAKA